VSRIYLVQDGRGERRLTEADLPLRLGGADAGDLELPDLERDRVLAYIALSEGHAYVQPADDAPPLYHNHQRLDQSAWLKSGDRLELGPAMLYWSVQGDQVQIRIGQRLPSELLSPPPEPPQAVGIQTAAAVVASPAGPGRHKWRRYLLPPLLALLVLGVAFVLFATPVAIQISPEPQRQSLSGLPPPLRVWDRYLVWPGSYRLQATKEGHYPLDQTLDLSGDGFRELRFELPELPGRIFVRTDPVVPFRLLVDGAKVPVGPDGLAEISRGRHQLRLETGRYLPELEQLEVAGLGLGQQVRFSLRPAWAQVSIASEPAGAQVRVDDQPLGTTPLQTELLQGRRRLFLTLAQHKSVHLDVEVRAGQPLALSGIQLPPADGRLALSSRPAGATLRVDAEYQGSTPLDLALSAGTEHLLELSEPGYQTRVERLTLAPEEVRQLELELTPEYGVVFLTSQPADASLRVDGRPAGSATQRLRLTTRAHRLEIAKPGYQPEIISVTPRAGFSQTLEVALKARMQARTEVTPGTITSPGGQRLHLIRPGGPFRMGASRREPGRRANESRRLVQLTRPFYLSQNEVTNAELRRFRPDHDSGSSDGASLDGDLQPAVNVGWDEAARYCNWLSQQEGLPPAYREEAGKMRAVIPPTSGYRMPSEAEWAYVARLHRRAEPARYPWVGSFPPLAKVGNYADARIADTLAEVVPGYDDGYRGSAPVGSFPADPGGFYDLGGNVAEWTNDFYAVYPRQGEQLVIDPTGPTTGDHRTVRGAGWRHGNLTELRLSYRDYSRSPRSDLGFRIARYAQ